MPLKKFKKRKNSNCQIIREYYLNNNVAKLPRCLCPIRHYPFTAPLEIEYKVNRETF